MTEPIRPPDIDVQTLDYTIASLVGAVTLIGGLMAWLKRKAAASARIDEQFRELRGHIDELRQKQAAGDELRDDMSKALESLRRQVDQIPTRDELRDLGQTIATAMRDLNSRIDRILLEQRG